MPLVRQEKEIYQIDLEALLLLFMGGLTSSLFTIGTKAFDIGQQKAAIACFELAASLSLPLSRMKDLIFDHVLLTQIFSDTHKQRLLDEENYILLARHQVLLLLSGASVNVERVDMGEFLAKTFKGYAEIPKIELNQKEIEVLYKLDDGDLRNAVSSILDGVNPVTARREANKPHGAFEISDMEVLVRHNNTIYRLSMPFKSALDPDCRDSSTVPVKVAYQIIRPFLQFRDGVVVFITAKPCSQYLHNYIKAANDVLGLSIEVIEYQELGKLLKFNNLLLKQTG